MKKLVVTVVQNHIGDVLSMRRAVGRDGAAVWGLPTRKIAANEPADAATVQMVQRDTGITCSPERQIASHIGPNGTLTEYWIFKAQSGTPRDPLSGSVRDVAFRPVNDFLSRVLAPLPVPVVEALRNNGKRDFTP